MTGPALPAGLAWGLIALFSLAWVALILHNFLITTLSLI